MTLTGDLYAPGHAYYIKGLSTLNPQLTGATPLMTILDEVMSAVHVFNWNVYR